jgi:hypothetical protein
VFRLNELRRGDCLKTSYIGHDKEEEELDVHISENTYCDHYGRSRFGRQLTRKISYCGHCDGKHQNEGGKAGGGGKRREEKGREEESEGKEDKQEENEEKIRGMRRRSRRMRKRVR